MLCTKDIYIYMHFSHFSVFLLFFFWGGWYGKLQFLFYLREQERLEILSLNNLTTNCLKIGVIFL